MANSQPQSELEEKMSFDQKISQDFNTDERLGPRHQLFGQERGRPAFPHRRLVTLSLGLLNAVLLIAAVVIGIYCAKAQDISLQVSNSAIAPLIAEMNFLRNQSGIVRAKLEAQGALVKEQASHAQLKLQVNQQKTLTDGLQAQIETLHTVKANLQTNKTTFEENCGRCRQGWILLKSSCYYFSSRHVSNSKKNWLDSRADCISQGGDLLVIHNLEEQQLISDNFPKQSSSSMWWQNGFWIGLTDVLRQGTWVWVNNVTEVETMYWRSGQPERDGPQSGNCAAFYFYADSRKTWYNGNCNNHLYNWICEREPS